ncbi:hypothetical protein CGCA056_v010963 [Colletotrichum aenigma]|uniref:uncharacterized protein n=1 Tax=Colletotrichum aenigma TaxID=1215731 RepID=UPI00187298D5|nr:uncharacterized protein CGCA056_v010963 [Colletotrichum aenigma]KAF5517548.1 hypothetical protein CGCA056_v010963 [Colletotrichum aenigma]
MKFTILIFAGAAAAFVKCGTPSNDQLRGGCDDNQAGGCEMWCGKRCPSSNFPVCIPKANKDYDCVCART